MALIRNEANEGGVSRTARAKSPGKDTTGRPGSGWVDTLNSVDRGGRAHGQSGGFDWLAG